jgi:hypothetical protein
MIDSYDDITVELLDREWTRLASMADEFDLTTLTSQYYAELIRRDAADAAGGELYSL